MTSLDAHLQDLEARRAAAWCDARKARSERDVANAVAESLRTELRVKTAALSEIAGLAKDGRRSANLPVIDRIARDALKTEATQP